MTWIKLLLQQSKSWLDIQFAGYDKGYEIEFRFSSFLVPFSIYVRSLSIKSRQIVNNKKNLLVKAERKELHCQIEIFTFLYQKWKHPYKKLLLKKLLKLRFLKMYINSGWGHSWFESNWFFPRYDYVCVFGSATTSLTAAQVSSCQNLVFFHVISLSK